MKKNVAVLMGGYSSEHDISVKSGNTVYNNINTNNFIPFKIIVEKENWNLINNDDLKYPISKDDFSVKIDGKKIKFDIAFIMIHGSPGEDGIIQNYFAKLNIPFTGPTADVAKLTFDKKKCTDFAKKNGFNVAKSILINRNSNLEIENIEENLNYPLFVKANNSGSSYGISKAYNREELIYAIDKSFGYDNEVLIEEFLDGREVSVGVMYFQNEIKVFGISEIVSKNDFFDYEAKYEGNHEVISPARLNNQQKLNVEKASKNLYKKLKMTGFSRTDFIFIGDEPYLLEINSIPGMTEESIFPKQVKMNGISLENLFTYIIDDTLTKFEK